MHVTAALQILARQRRDEIVVTTMGSSREWSRISESPLDFHYLPSAMGHAPMIGLGLALAQPEREVIVLNGDGSMLMSLGCLVTIVASGAKNLTLIVLDNGVYEVTGGQATPAAGAGVDYPGLARGAGFATHLRCDQLDEWRELASRLRHLPGPRFVSLRVEAVREDYVPQISGSMADRIARFQGAIGVREPPPAPN